MGPAVSMRGADDILQYQPTIMKSLSAEQEKIEKRCDTRQWYSQRLGRLLLDEERRQLDDILPYLFGYHLVQVGKFTEEDLLGASRVLHRVVMDQDYGANPLRPAFYSYPDALPIESDSIDVLVLHHTLEFEPDPHQILREADRTLIPEGHVVIMCFNPWSLWGVWRIILKRRGRAPWCGQFFSATRLKDWLALLGFDTVLARPYFFRPPVHNERVMHKLRFLDRLGQRWWPLLPAAYIIVAKKRVATLTPIKPRWRPRRSRQFAPDVAGPVPN